MNPLRVVQVVKAHRMYDWARGHLARNHIELVERVCSSVSDLAECAGDADVVWSYGGGNIRDLLRGANLECLTRCGAIVRTGSGVDDIDIAKATELGIIVVNTPKSIAEAVSDHTIALLFSLLRQIPIQDRRVRLGTWNCMQPLPGHTMAGSILGLVGFGHIPQCLVRRLAGFQLHVLVYDPFVEPEAVRALGAEPAELDDLLSTSDLVSLHCPLTEQTFHLIGERELRLMRSSALLLNTARGPIVDEQALVRALQEGWISGAALDVTETEPPDPDNPLLTMDNVIITPHSGAYERDFPASLLQESVEAIIALAGGRWPASVVNPAVKPRWTAMGDCPH